MRQSGRGHRRRPDTPNPQAPPGGLNCGGQDLMIVRVARRTRFVVIDQAVVDDERLSYAALGLLAYLLGRPDNWEIRSEALARNVGRSGRDAVRAALRELEDVGYLHRQKVRGPKGRWRTESVIYEQASSQPRIDGFSVMSATSESDGKGPGHDQDGFSGAGLSGAGASGAGEHGSFTSTEEPIPSDESEDSPPTEDQHAPIPDKKRRDERALSMTRGYYDWVRQTTGARPAENFNGIRGVIAHLLQDFGPIEVTRGLKGLQRAVPPRPVTRQTLLAEIRGLNPHRPPAGTPRPATNDWVDREAELIANLDRQAPA